jgi:cell wall-associated NlpC family hydrolase
VTGCAFRVPRKYRRYGRSDSRGLVIAADGTMTSPGHVGIVTGHGQMIEAYASGYPVRYASYDRPGLVGFTDPRGGA